MNRDQVWKNFDLGQELNVAGGFIYEGLRRFHEMATLENADEIFEFLYNVSVGLERLLKVTIVLIEHDGSVDQQKFEESLRTHNHIELLRRVRVRDGLRLGTQHNDFLGLLGTFYNTLRYDRFTVTPSWNPDKEKAALRQFLEKRVKDLEPQPDGFALCNSVGARKHIHNLVQKISTELYGIIRSRTSELNLYSHELREGSKAQRLFVKGEFGFLPQEILKKELLLFFMNAEASTGLMKWLKSIEPLDFDPALASDYVRAFLSDENRREVEDEVSGLYDDMGKERRDRRFSIMDAMGNPRIDFSDDDECEDEAEKNAF